MAIKARDDTVTDQADTTDTGTSGTPIPGDVVDERGTVAVTAADPIAPTEVSEAMAGDAPIVVAGRNLDDYVIHIYDEPPPPPEKLKKEDLVSVEAGISEYANDPFAGKGGTYRVNGITGVKERVVVRNGRNFLIDPETGKVADQPVD